MHDILTRSVDCRCTKPPPILPSRLIPRVSKDSRSLQPKYLAHAPRAPIASLRSLRTIARIVLAIAPFVCQIASSTLLEWSARAQPVAHSEAVALFAKLIEEASGPLHHPGALDPWCDAG